VFPFAFSFGFAQDPTHICPINHVTLAYFDPLAKTETGQFYGLYPIYRPLPWKIEKVAYDHNGLIECALTKRIIDKSYGVIGNNGMGAN